MIISMKDYRNKVLGCWMGKNIGGTLGAPMEWKRQVNDVTFYTQELGGNPLPNDDLDLQLIWLIALEERGLDINARILGEYWLYYIAPHWVEYGNGKTNMRAGLVPPLSGIENNPHKDSCGAFIRSEIWACIAPGCPEVAAKFAYEDAIVDHGNGEGMYAEIFCAAIESAAFVEKDVDKLLNIGLSYIPEDCGIAKVVNLVRKSYAAGKPYLEVRDEILTKYRAQYWAYAGISQEDREKGFADGPIGWDAPANIGFMVIGWLYGEGEFGKSLCITVNCGEDTDCTAATLGSIFGIIHGIDAIPEIWIKPIGRGIKTMCLNLGDLQGLIPADIDVLAARVEKIARQVVLRYGQFVELSEIKATDLADLSEKQLFSETRGKSIYRSLNAPIYKFGNCDVIVDYLEGPYVKSASPKKVKLKIEGRFKTQESINIKWYNDEGWIIGPAKYGKVFIGGFGTENVEFEFELYSEKVHDFVNRFAVELTIEGKHTVMLIPIVLLNNNLLEIRN